MTDESVLIVTGYTRGAQKATNPVAVKKQESTLRKYNKIKSLKDKELYPWQQKVVNDVEGSTRVQYHPFYFRTTFNHEATVAIAESTEGKPKTMDAKKWMKLPEKERIHKNLEARYPEYRIEEALID